VNVINVQRSLGWSFTSIIVTIASGKDRDKLCLNAQCSPTPYFYYF